MSHQSARVAWDERLTEYDFGLGHPMNPIRLQLAHDLALELGVLDSAEVVVPAVASDDELATVHDPAFIEYVRQVSGDPSRADESRGIGSADTPAFRGMHEASALAAGASLSLARDLAAGRITRGVNIAGGLHHAMPDRAAGFCVYNDVSLAIRYLLDAGQGPIVYVDLDAHHGDGVEMMFWEDPRVTTISFHETGRVLFPGTGFPGDVGGDAALGHAVNVALPPGTGDADWLRAVHAVVPPVVHAIRPAVLVTQHGVDGHHEDPLTHMGLSVEAMVVAARLMRSLADEVTNGRWLATGGGGYSIHNVVPRTWAHLLATAVGERIPWDRATPENWRSTVEGLGFPVAETMGDLGGSDPWWRSWGAGYDPDSAVDQAVMAAREAVFGHHGLDPWFD